MISIAAIKAEDTYELRKEILRKNMTLSHEMKGDHDSDALHLGIYECDKLVCIGSFMKAARTDLSGKQYQLRGMATSDNCQGKGYGKSLLQEAEEILKSKDIDIIWCNARVAAIDFYKKNGYRVMSDIFEVPQIGPHYVMFKKLNSL
jgi:ribosomal protein S18 acetylase RimI-like enzyme